jgi:hypothetical protein
MADEETTSERVILAMEDRLSGPADASIGALGRLEAQIAREQAALGRLESELGRASAKLEAMADGVPDDRAVAAFDRQRAAVGKLEAELASAKETLEIMGYARVTPRDMESAVAAVDRLTTKLEAARAKQAELGEAANARSVNVEAYRKQADTVAKLGDTIAGQRDKISTMGERLHAAGEKSLSAEQKLRLMGKTLRASGADMGAADSHAIRLIASLMKMGPEVAALTVGILVLTSAAAAFVSIFAKGITASGAMRDEFLRLKGEVKALSMGWFGFVWPATVSATQLQAAINGVNSSTNGLSRDKVEGYAVQLAKARVPAKDLGAALNAMVIAGTGGGDKMAQRFLGLATTYRMFGKDVTKLAEVFKKQFGDVAAAKTLELGIQVQRLRENLDFMFSGADVEPFLRGLQAILSMFDKNTSSAKTMRSLITALVEKGINLFLRFAITLAQTYLWIREHERAWQIAGLAVKAVGFVFAGLAAVVLLAVAAIGAAATLLLAPFVAVTAVIGDAVAWVLRHWDSLKTGAADLATTVGAWFLRIAADVSDAIDFIGSISLTDIGRRMMDGLAKGIDDAIEAVKASVRNVGKAAIDTFKSVLGIHSPSLVARVEAGQPVGLGMAAGMTDTIPMINVAAERMSAAAVAMPQANDNGSPAQAYAPQAPPTIAVTTEAQPAPPSMPMQSKSESSGPIINFNNCTFGSTSMDDIRVMMFQAWEEASKGARAA